MKKQSRKIGTAGSFQNQLMGNNGTTPIPGEWFTELLYSDRRVGKVLEVSNDGLTAKLQMYEAEAAGTNLPMGHQSWKFNETPNTFTVQWNEKRGKWLILGKIVEFTKKMYEEAENAGYFAIAAYLRKYKPELLEQVYKGNVHPQAVLEGVTREKVTKTPISIIFGVCDYRYDWEF